MKLVFTTLTLLSLPLISMAHTPDINSKMNRPYPFDISLDIGEVHSEQFYCNPADGWAHWEINDVSNDDVIEIGMAKNMQFPGTYWSIFVRAKKFGKAHFTINYVRKNEKPGGKIEILKSYYYTIFVEPNC
jgi:hypothetical protein